MHKVVRDVVVLSLYPNARRHSYRINYRDACGYTCHHRNSYQHA
jgi:hypothetical protein